MDIRKLAIFVGSILFAIGIVMGLAGYRPTVEIGVTLQDFRIDMTGADVRAGDQVRLHIRNEGAEYHELEVAGYGLEVEDIAPGETRTLTFRANRAGRFELVCRIAGHYQRDMSLPFVVNR